MNERIKTAYKDLLDQGIVSLNDVIYAVMNDAYFEEERLDLMRYFGVTREKLKAMGFNIWWKL